MVVAVAVVLVVQVAVNQVIDVVPVRNRFVTAAGAVNVVAGVGFASVTLGAIGGIGAGNFKSVLVYVVTVDVVHVTVVKVVNVIAVLDGGVTAIRTVGVFVIIVLVTF